MPSPAGSFPVLLECGEVGPGQHEGRPPPQKENWATILDVEGCLLSNAGSANATNSRRERRHHREPTGRPRMGDEPTHCIRLLQANPGRPGWR